MKNFLILLWRCTVAILWVLSLLVVIRAGFAPTFMALPSAEPSYLWVEVILMSIVITIECALLYLMLRPQKYAWSPSRLGIAFGVFLIFSIGAVNTLLTFDLPEPIYVPSMFTILVTLLLLLSWIITIVISLVKWISKRTSAA